MIEAPSIHHTNNLPARLTRLIGRNRELDLLCSWLLPDITNTPQAVTEFDRQMRSGFRDVSPSPVRILTLTGPGGCGKTTLALEVARHLLPYYPEGVWLVELATLFEPARLAQIIISTLGLIESDDLPASQRLKAYLKPRQILLILDNCEHLIEEVARLVGELSASCPNLRILATSREVLNVTGEQQWQVPSLSLPPFQTVPPSLIDSLASQYEAVALFVERAQTISPHFELTSQNASAIVKICQRLDGIPLALELAVARLRFLSVEQLAALLEHSLEVLRSGRRTALPRQQTLQATIEWSHSLLQPEEQLLFRRLAVFMGGFTLEAAQAVTTDRELTPLQLLEILGRLVDKSLVLLDHSQKGQNELKPERRYRLLETVREFAQEKLKLSGELETHQQKQADYYLALAERHEPLLFSAAQQQVISHVLLPDLANIRAALSWYSARNNYQDYLRLAASLWFFWLNGGLVSEGRQWLEIALPLLDDPTVGSDDALKAKVLMADGQLAWVQGKQAQAVSKIARSVELFEKTDEQRFRAFTVGLLGLVRISETSSEKELAEGYLLIKQSVALFRDMQDLWCLGNALLWSGNIQEAQKQYRPACDSYSEAINLFRDLKETLLLPLALSFLAQSLFRLGEVIQAFTAMKESLLLRQVTGEKWYASLALEIIAQIIGELELFEPAAVIFGAAESLRREINASTLPSRENDYIKILALVKANLGQLNFEKAFNMGLSMSFAQAVEYLLLIEPEILNTPKQVQSSGSAIAVGGASSGHPGNEPLDALSQRELELLALVAEGATSQEIASKLVISTGTVKWHLSNIFSKLDAKNRTQAVARARELGLI